MAAVRPDALGYRTKTVVFVQDSPAYGGLEIHMLGLLRKLDRLRYHPIVLLNAQTNRYWQTPQRFVDEVTAAGVQVLTIPPPPADSPFGAASALRQLQSLVRSVDAQVLHIHTTHFRGARKMQLAAYLAGVPVIVRSEHLPPSQHLRGRSELTMSDRSALRALDAITSSIVTVSDADRAEHIALLGRPPHKVHRSYNGIDLTQFSAKGDTREAKRQLGLNPDLPVVGITGRLSEQKGHRFFIDAAARILQNYGPVTFLIVGAGPLQATLENQVRELGIEQYVHFTGFQADVASCIAAMDVTVMASLYESLGIAMLEYMAMGKPTVVTDLPCFREVISDRSSGLIVPVRDAGGLAAGVMTYLREPAFAADVAKTAVRVVRNQFTLEQNTKDIMALYDRLLDKHFRGEISKLGAYPAK